MSKRGLQLLGAHIRSFDPGEPNARERLERALGEPLARQLLSAVGLGVRVDAPRGASERADAHRSDRDAREPTPDEGTATGIAHPRKAFYRKTTTRKRRVL